MLVLRREQIVTLTHGFGVDTKAGRMWLMAYSKGKGMTDVVSEEALYGMNNMGDGCPPL